MIQKRLWEASFLNERLKQKEREKNECSLGLGNTRSNDAEEDGHEDED